MLQVRPVHKQHLERPQENIDRASNETFRRCSSALRTAALWSPADSRLGPATGIVSRMPHYFLASGFVEDEAADA